MSRKSELMAELTIALKAKYEAKQAWAEKRAEALAAKSDYDAAKDAVEEIEEELRTGKSGREIIDQVGTTHTSEPVDTTHKAAFWDGGKASPDAELEQLLHDSATEDNIAASRRRRKAVKA